MRADSRPRRRSGAAIIEVLVAIVMLALTGTALITMLGQTSYSMQTTIESERLARAATVELNRIVLADRSTLVASVGRRAVRGWTIDVASISPALFDVRIAESDTGAALLRTTLYRPLSDSIHETP
jgi:Tfp pilus assembly protein PilV